MKSKIHFSPRKTLKPLDRKEKGQILIIVALAIVAIVAIIGLSLDVGLMFIENARLRRAVDAAALAAALQYREGYEPGDLSRAALEILVLNGIIAPTATLEICDPALGTRPNPVPTGLSPGERVYHNGDLCTNPLRKLVRVIASGSVHLAFLPVIGISEVPIAARAVSEAASVDLVLVIDTSESMTYDYPAGDPLRDPSICNNTDIEGADGMPGECQPFEGVKQAAVEFVRTAMYFPFDRVAVVSFNKSAVTVLGFEEIDYDSMSAAAIESTIVEAIEGIGVYEAEGICPSGQPCRSYQDNNGDGVPDDDNGDGVPDYFTAFRCGDPYILPPWPDMDPSAWPDPFYPSEFLDPENNVSNCPSTNLGGGLTLAGNQFAIEPIRQDALWAVILLTDGSANGGRCPESTWGAQKYFNPDTSELEWDEVLCRDPYASTRHCNDSDPVKLARCQASGGVWDPWNYDADDYARDAADFVALDQGAFIYSIGLGAKVQNSTSGGDHDAGEKFLIYAANMGDGIPGDFGLYYYAPGTEELRAIFQRIAENIAIRLSQ